MLACSRRSAVALLVPVWILGAAIPVGRSATPTSVHIRAITQICSGALLFEGSHRLGTRAGAIAVARDIRASTRRRLERVAAVPVPRSSERLVDRWIALERRLAEAYAQSWVGIFDAIDAAHTPRERARLPALLNQLLRSPDRLRFAAARLEAALQVPDCTGGGAPAPAFRQDSWGEAAVGQTSRARRSA